ncbi:MAG: hypothetical protein NXH75_11570 [Halobacteriovoraceae bacterium]|nr:hypothetical protein [Halobacteriovoraceae bacterium]
MKKHILFLFIFSGLFSQGSFGKDLKISHSTAGQIERVIKENRGKNGLEERVVDILLEDNAVLKFSETLVDLCQYPEKYNFPVVQEERNCNKEEIKVQVIGDLAFGVVEKNLKNTDAIVIENSLNELLNSYIDKYRSVVKAFSNWN